MEIKSKIGKSAGKSEKQGFVKRFLNWIARGADKSGIGMGSCPF
jgi:hypothetical protein